MQPCPFPLRVRSVRVTGERPAGRRRALVLQAGVALSVLVADQVTKAVAVSRLALHETVPVIPGYFDLTHVLNSGGVWGLGGDASPLVRTVVFLALPSLITIFACWYSLQLPARERARPFALALLVGGAIGNLLDRLRLGEVVDFLLFHWRGRWAWPAFNLADAAICVGIAVLLVASFLERDDEDGRSGG